MTTHKSICFVASNRETCEQVQKQLNTYLSAYVRSAIWCLNEPPPGDILQYDVFITSNEPVYRQISRLIPADKKVIVASRTIETKNLEAVLALCPGTEVLMVSNHEKTALKIIEDLGKLAIGNVVMHPHWPGKDTYPKHVKTAVAVGQHTVPAEIEQVINLGVRILDISTFVRLILELNLPCEIIDTISARYISAIVTILHRRLQMAAESEQLKNRLEAVLNTVDQGIIAVDNDATICIFNPAAEKMLGLGRREVIGTPVTRIIPQISREGMTCPNSMDFIQRIGDHYFIINTTPICNSMNDVSGAVISLKATHEVQELDSRVRRELKRKGNIAKRTFNDIVSGGEEFAHSIAMARKFAKSDLTILLEGESGTGKEIFVQSIHNSSPRFNAPFVAVNFAALPDNLVESELFGYEDGAFTGARKGGKTGLFEEAHTGTIFLDEIGDASLEVQKRLLRILEEKEVRRVGGNTVTPIDVRVIAATNQNLRQLIKCGDFRQDLYFRLCTIQIGIPPLRNRKKDIPALIVCFAQTLYQRELPLTEEAKEFLIHYDWPGNVRELQNVVKFLCNVVGDGEVATTSHLPQYLLEQKTDPAEHGVTADNSNINALVAELGRQWPLELIFCILSEMKQAERLNRTAGRYSIAASLSKWAIACPEHKVRILLKRLAEKDCITTLVTKQGSRLTKLGEEILSYLQYRYNSHSQLL